MLFSNSQLASFISDSFEPCWQSVRDVPVITVDFGGGNVVKRTLHGNIATYVCLADGSIVDILPGIYTAEEYQRRLSELLVVANSRPDQSVLVGYHREKSLPVPAAAAWPVRTDMRKLIIERPVEKLLSSDASTVLASSGGRTPILAADVVLNENVRRKQIHEKLAKCPGARPSDVCKWLYREVLHADLDDPYLGLGQALFASYPFKSGEHVD